MGDDEGIDWKRELFSASAPLAKDALPSYKKGFQKIAAARALAGYIKDFGDPISQDMHLKIFDFKMKGFDGVQKGLNFLDKGKEIKGFKVSNLDKIFLGYDLINIACKKDLNTVDKIDRACSKIVGAAGGIISGQIMGEAGSIIGASIGTFFCPGLGTAAGALVGGILGFVGGMVGSIVGGKVFGDFYDNVCSPYVKKGLNFLSGIIGKFRSGGIEFILPKEINEFNEIFSFDKCHFIAFEYENENDFSINQIIDLINSKFLINNIKIKNLNEAFETILKEISYGFLCKKNLPQISLNFNKEGLLYSIMDDFYKNTLTGNILTFLDYYLKSYVNGGFFEENFIFQWQNNKNENRDFLQKNLIDFTKYLFELTHDSNKINYISMYDLINEGKNDNNYISAFRIIGILENNLKYYKNIIFPDCSYFTQYDFDILPKWQSEIDSNIDEKNKAELIKNYHKLMSLRVTFLMNKIPFLKPYFELLKMITFAIHYLPNIQRIGLFPLFNNSLQNNYIGEKYCKSIPKVFPPLPIRKRINLEIEVSIQEIIDIFKDNNYENLNKFISICFYEAEETKIEKAIKDQRNLLNNIKNFVIEKIKNKLEEQDKYVINLFSDEKLKIKQLEEEFIEVLFIIPKIDLLEDYYIIYNTLSQQENEVYKPKKTKDYINQIRTFLDLKKEIEEILNIFGIYSMEYFEKESLEINQEIEKINKIAKEQEEKFIQKLKDEIKSKANNGLNEQQINEILNKKEIKDMIDRNKIDFNN